METKNLDKVLKKHFQHCKMHEYSLMKDRRCTCGVEKARVEAETLVLAAEWVLRANEWFDRFDRIDITSFAVTELRKIAEKLNGKTS